MNKRLASSLITILVAIMLSFFLVRSMPGDFIHLRATEIQMQQSLSYAQAYAIARSQYNYDPSIPLYRQFALYLNQLLHGDLGNSIVLRIPVATIIASALPWTIFLCSLALFCSFTLGCLIGLWVTWRRGKGWADPLVSFFAVIPESVPDFIIAILLIVIFAVNLRWFPFRGAYSVDVQPGFNLAFISSVFYYAALPVASYVLATVGGWILAMRASASSVLSEDFINVARAKGLKEKRILIQYLGRNAIMPLVPGLTISFAAMLSSSLFVESIFSYPGIGFFFGFAIGNRDFTLLQGILLISIIVIVLSNHLGEWIHGRLDPRVRRGGK